MVDCGVVYERHDECKGPDGEVQKYDFKAVCMRPEMHEGEHGPHIDSEHPVIESLKDSKEWANALAAKKEDKDTWERVQNIYKPMRSLEELTRPVLGSSDDPPIEYTKEEKALLASHGIRVLEPYRVGAAREFAVGRLINGDQKIVSKEEYDNTQDEPINPVRERLVMDILRKIGHLRIAVAEAAHYCIREGSSEDLMNAVRLLEFMIDGGVDAGRPKS